MRAKHPGNAPGLWPAFWLLNDDGSPGETDIMEQILSKPDEVVTTFHCWREGWAKGNSTKNINYASGWHTYSLQWIPGKVIWYVDGVEVWSFSSDCVENKPNYILANMAVGGSWPGAPTNATVFPAYLEIDYIRAYKYNPNGGSTLAGPGNGISYTPIVGTENPIRIGFTQATPETQSANGTVTISTTLTSDVTYDSAAVQFQYSNDTKDIATQSVMGTAASLVAGVPKVITNTFRIPASQSPGFIRVSVGYFSVNGSYWKNLKWETTTVIFGVDRVVGQYPTQSLTTNAVTTKPLTTNMAPLTTKAMTTRAVTTGLAMTTNMAPLTTKAMTTKPLTTRAVTTGLAMTTKAVTTKPLTTREATTAPVTSGVVTSGIAPEVTTGERGRPSPDVPDEVVTDSEDTNMSEAFALRAGWAITSLVVVLIPALI
eukprot:TRINITY_DN842_c0_g1_i4.p1 TRINITY_DN842_c0_g1~~TRINITY_DN842_c0_g1_i4.p1  ORF type:complete len:429 (+),score=79.13 TRINITY_DN842_c0_g1_i4:548-1834(+)